MGDDLMWMSALLPYLFPNLDFTVSEEVIAELLDELAGMGYLDRQNDALYYPNDFVISLADVLVPMLSFGSCAIRQMEEEVTGFHLAFVVGVGTNLVLEAAPGKDGRTWLQLTAVNGIELSKLLFRIGFPEEEFVEETPVQEEAVPVRKVVAPAKEEQPPMRMEKPQLLYKMRHTFTSRGEVLHQMRASSGGKERLMILNFLGRALSLLSVPLTLVMIFSMIRMVKKEQRARIRTNIIGIIMAPMTLLINVIFLNRALPDFFSVFFVGGFVAVFGLGFGLAWGQTAKLYEKDEQLVVKRSIAHLVFWGLSYAITQLLAAVATTGFVAGGLVTMLFSAGSTVGTNVNMLVRYQKLKARRA